MKTEGSGSESRSSSQRHGSGDPDPDPHQNVMDLQHCLLLRITEDQLEKNLDSDIRPHLSAFN
jgi:hypothetical protein